MSSSCPPGGAEMSRAGRRCSTPRGDSASTSTRRAAAAGSAGAARWRSQKASTRSTGSRARARALTPETETERLYAADRGLATGRRLGCTALVVEDVVIDVPPESQVYRQVVRKEADAREIAVDPVVRLYTVEVEEPQLGSTRSDAARLLDALEREWHVHDLQIDTHVMQRLQSALRTSDTASLAPWHVTVAVHDRAVVTAVWPGFHDSAYGIAFDVGSTTVAGHLCDLRTGAVVASAGEMNPQIRFGEDLMSRVSYVMLNPGSVKELTARRPRLPREAHRRALPRCRGRAHRRARGVRRGQPGDAPSPARHRPH